jgi:hypothetical protein
MTKILGFIVLAFVVGLIVSAQVKELLDEWRLEDLKGEKLIDAIRREWQAPQLKRPK